MLRRLDDQQRRRIDRPECFGSTAAVSTRSSSRLGPAPALATNLSLRSTSLAVRWVAVALRNRLVTTGPRARNWS